MPNTGATGLTVGSGSFVYEPLAAWQRLPDGVTLHETPGVAVDAQDSVYVLTRNTANPVVVLDREGGFLRSFGAGTFSERTHGISIAPDGSIYCADDGTHTITRWSPAGELLLTIGTPGKPAAPWSGEPFNRPTHCAVSPTSGDLYITDGYGNSRVHRFSPEGRHLLSWGDPGIDPGQFIRPHNVAIDAQDNVYIADRECHRVQIFDAEGRFLRMWSNIHRPDGMTLGPDGNMYIGELTAFDGLGGAPGLGHRVSILNRDGALLARFGDPVEGEEPGQFIAPHAIAVDSRGDIYVGEVSYTFKGRHLDPPREVRSLSKLVRLR